MLETAIAPVPQPTAADDGVWIEALPARVYHTPQYGEVVIPVDKLERMITNFKANVRGQEIATDFEHGMDQAKGKQASGWYKDFEVRTSSDDPTQMSLWANVQLTKEAKQDVQDGKWKYWSLEWDDEYETDTGAIVPDVVIGGGLTNRPVAKRTMPINFSEEMWNELDDETKKQLLSENAAWAHSDPGIVAPLYGATEQPDPGFGLTVPRVTGDPTKDAAIGGGWRREPLPAGDPALADELTKPELREPSGKDKHFAESGEIKYLQTAQTALESFLTSETSEPDKDDAQLAQSLIAHIKSMIGDEQMEPTAAAMSESKGGKTVEFTEENVTELRQLLAIPDDADSDAFMSEARNAFSELKTFKDSVGQTQQEKAFSEQFPDVWAEHRALLESNRVGSARAFAESVQRLTTPKGEGDNITFEPTRNGLSALALETIADAHKKFSEGTATMEDFESVIKAITNGGVVEFGEVGSSAEKDLPAIDTSTAQGIQATRKVFADKVGEIQQQYEDKNDGKKMEFSEAVAKASELYPDLAAAYRATAA